MASGVRTEVSGRPLLPTLRGRLDMRWLNPRYLVVAAGLGLLLAHGVLGLTLLQQSQAKTGVDADTAIARRALRNPSGLPIEEARQELRAAEAQLPIVLGAFPEGIDTTSLYLDFGMGQSLHLGGSGCGRPVSPWSWKTVRKRGSPHPFRIEPEQLPGPTEPASCKDGPVIRRRCSWSKNRST